MHSNGEFVKCLGQGAYGTVDLVRYRFQDDGYSFLAAVKSSGSETYPALQKEVEILTELRGYADIVECFSHQLEQSFDVKGFRVYKLLLEYASQGSLSALMDNYTDRKILEGLVSIHAHGYVHCDLKSDNLLVFPLRDSFEVKISDFGSALEVGEVPGYWAIDYPFVGTPPYMPPESLKHGVANKALDLWSLGCLVLEMFTGQRPWAGVGTFDLLALLLEGKAPDIPESVPSDAREFIQTCFSRNPEDRGTAFDLMMHRFLCLEEEELVSDDVSERRETEEKLVSDVEESRRDTEEKIVSDVAVVEESRRDALLLLFKLKLKWITRGALNKPLKLNIFPSKPPQFRKFFNRFLRLKTMPMTCSLVSVQ